MHVFLFWEILTYISDSVYQYSSSYTAHFRELKRCYFNFSLCKSPFGHFNLILGYYRNFEMGAAPPHMQNTSSIAFKHYIGCMCMQEASPCHLLRICQVYANNMHGFQGKNDLFEKLILRMNSYKSFRIRILSKKLYKCSSTAA